MDSTNNKKEDTLFIFEGSNPEYNIVGQLEDFLSDGHAIKSVYSTNIYHLYEVLRDEYDGDADIVEVIKDLNKEANEELKNRDRNSIYYVYLFFDYDAHATGADDKKIQEMLDFFDNETEQGKLYLHYPMVEAIKHYTDKATFETLTAKCKGQNCPYRDDCARREACMREPHYKDVVNKSSPRLAHRNAHTPAVWRELVAAHLCKANLLVYDSFALPAARLEQRDIFGKQLEKHVSRRCPEVAVLSAFPLYVLDYLGCQRTLAKLQQAE